MSNKCSNHVWQNSKQRGSALVVLLALADMANDDGECYPGKSKLSEKCRLTVRNLTQTLRGLEAAGELSIIRRRVGNFNRSNIYKINMEGSDPQITRVMIPRSSGSDPEITRVVIPRSPDPLKNHNLNPIEGDAVTRPGNLILKSIQERKRDADTDD